MLLKRVTEQIMRTKGFVDLESNIILYITKYCLKFKLHLCECLYQHIVIATRNKNQKPFLSKNSKTDC